ncbi:hypothetical protein MES4922_30461 [Mesorhizobium ventifaucium]|uniref:Uncharacterized protein n=1 Tax=Mesorhizobium ventifaucium TaxID=666020 RepID=A0ABM9E0I3_9HYPH|nr:hypothetical protein MES4922_30461 [Mesorhizobium ventifaucium]
MDELHTALARDGRAQAVTLDSDGVAVAANEFLYKKSVTMYRWRATRATTFHRKRLPGNAPPRGRWES